MALRSQEETERLNELYLERMAANSGHWAVRDGGRETALASPWTESADPDAFKEKLTPLSLADRVAGFAAVGKQYAVRHE